MELNYRTSMSLRNLPQSSLLNTKKEIERVKPEEIELPKPKESINENGKVELSTTLDLLEEMNNMARTNPLLNEFGSKYAIDTRPITTNNEVEETPDGGLPKDYLEGLVKDIQEGATKFAMLAERVKSAKTYEEKLQLVKDYIYENNLDIGATTLLKQLNSANSPEEIENMYLNITKENITNNIINYYSDNYSDKDFNPKTVLLQIREVLFGATDSVNMFNDSMDSKIYQLFNEILNDPKFIVTINVSKSYAEYFTETPEGSLPKDYLEGLVKDIQEGSTKFAMLAERVKSAKTYEEKLQLVKDYIYENNLDIGAATLLKQLNSANSPEEIENMYLNIIKENIANNIIDYYNNNCSDKDFNFETVLLQIREVLFGATDSVNMLNDSMDSKIYQLFNEILNDPKFMIAIDMSRNFNWLSQ